MQIKMLAAAALTVVTLSACTTRPVVVETPVREVMVPVPAPYPVPVSSPTPDMMSLHDRVHAALMTGMGSAANDIAIRVDGSKVYLTGHVGSSADHTRAHDIAHDVSGVGSVDHSGLVVH
ncbi:MAG: BON domain-containing protein [Thermomonas sp.]